MIELSYLLNIRRLFIEAFFLSIPEAIIMISFAFLFCGLKHELSKKRILVFSLFIFVTDIVVRLFLEGTGLHSLIYLILSIIYIKNIFNLNYLKTIVSYIISAIFSLITQVIYTLLIPILFNITFNELANTTDIYKIFLKIGIIYVYFIMMFVLLFITYRKEIIIINLNKHSLLSSTSKIFNTESLDSLRLFSIVFIPIIFFLVSNYSIYYYQAFNHVEVSSIIYLIINAAAIIVSSILMFFLIRKIIGLKYYKIEWNTQQKYLNDINELIKSLRKQKHGFLNHLNILYGYISLEKYEKAKEYLANINQIVTTTNNVIGIDNPSLNALINVKSKIAERENIKFNVSIKTDLSQLNFKIFELGEAVGNIIDNAFEATKEQKESKRLVNIDIFSNNKYYIFDIQNTGKTIATHILDKIFEEGFTTKEYKKDDHGLGLYITKKIIENNKGKIEVDTKNKMTSFKIYLPKVIKNESKVS